MESRETLLRSLKKWLLRCCFVALTVAPFAASSQAVSTSSSLAGLIRSWNQHLATGAPLYLDDALRSLGVPSDEVDGQESKIVSAVSAEGLRARPGYAENWSFRGGENVRAISFGIKPGTHIVVGLSVELKEESCISPTSLINPIAAFSSRPAGGDGTQAWSYTDEATHGKYSVLVSKQMNEKGACAQTLTFTFN